MLDAWEAVLWVSDQGKEILGLDITRMATGMSILRQPYICLPSELGALEADLTGGGSSAGANLAAIMCQRAADRGFPKFSLQLLSVPVTDNTADTTNNISWNENQHSPALPAPKMMWYRNHYLPNKEDWANPEASPLFWKGDWSKLPPACFVLGELDVLRTEGEQFGKKLEDAGVKAEVNIMKRQPHPFIAMDAALEAGSRAITLFCDALHRTMHEGK